MYEQNLNKVNTNIFLYTLMALALGFWIGSLVGTLFFFDVDRDRLFLLPI